MATHTGYMIGDHMEETITQELLDLFAKECAAEGWIVDQIEVESILTAISERHDLKFNRDEYFNMVADND